LRPSTDEPDTNSTTAKTRIADGIFTAVRGAEELKLEVKGLSGPDMSADVTVNEYQKMMADEHRADYRICVVLDALTLQRRTFTSFITIVRKERG
jgi:hypothetical protein